MQVTTGFHTHRRRRTIVAAVIGACAWVGLVGAPPASAQAVPDASCPGPSDGFGGGMSGDARWAC